MILFQKRKVEIIVLELQIKDLCVAFNGKEILHNITFDIENGAFIGIVGPSGAGKSTLLKQINRLDPSKTGGSILWRGKDVDDYDVHELRRNLAYVFQKAVMFDGTTEENIKLSLKYGNEFKPEEIEALYQTVLEEASISQDILDTPAQDLSGGQQQRVGIARDCSWDLLFYFLMSRPHLWTSRQVISSAKP